MENVKEFFLEELKKISMDELNEHDKRHLNNCIRVFRNNGKTMDEMLELTPGETQKEYIRSMWETIHPF